MANELLFLLHIISIGVSCLSALRLGKEALIVSIALQSVLANIFVLKTITFFGRIVTTTDAFTIGIIISLQLLQEYWGKKAAQQALMISFCSLLFSMVMSQIILLYTPSSTDTIHLPLYTLFNNTPRITAASFIAYVLSMQFDCLFYEYLKKISFLHYFTLRNMVCASTSQLLDTILFSYLGLYGIVESIHTILVFSYMIKLLCLVIATPFLALTHYISVGKEV